MSKKVLKRVVVAAVAVVAILGLVEASDEPVVVRWLAMRDPEQVIAIAGQDWVGSEVGSMPLVLLVPHGGAAEPSGLPDRICGGCVASGRDTDTDVIATQIAAAIEARIGRRPYVVRNLLHRSKFDANRDLEEATAGVAAVAPIWENWHTRIEEAKRGALTTNARALVLDLHRHAHDEQRIELGYLIWPDTSAAADLGGSSIAALDGAGASGDRGAALLRGPRALGTLFGAAGFAAVPSESIPALRAGEEYFNGAYNVYRHGSRLGGNVDAIQVEMNDRGLLNTPEQQARFAGAFAETILRYLAEQYGWTPR